MQKPKPTGPEACATKTLLKLKNTASISRSRVRFAPEGKIFAQVLVIFLCLYLSLCSWSRWTVLAHSAADRPFWPEAQADLPAARSCEPVAGSHASAAGTSPEDSAVAVLDWPVADSHASAAETSPEDSAAAGLYWPVADSHASAAGICPEDSPQARLSWSEAA
jgi:hypothetical protein